MKKKIQNDKRRRKPAEAQDDPGAVQSNPASRPHQPAQRRNAAEGPSLLGRPEGAEFEAGLLGYVRMVVSLIEGRRVSRDEIVNMLVRAVRQHSMARRRRIDYVVEYVRGNPP